MQRCTNIFFGIFFRDGSVFNKNVFGFFLEWFKSRDTIRAHMNYVHVQGPQKCDTCGKISANRKALRKHQTIHMESWKDRFKCVICCKGFRDSTKLKVRFLDFIQIQFLAERFFFFNLFAHFRNIHIFIQELQTHIFANFVANHFVLDLLCQRIE